MANSLSTDIQVNESREGSGLHMSAVLTPIPKERLRGNKMDPIKMMDSGCCSVRHVVKDGLCESYTKRVAYV